LTQLIISGGSAMLAIAAVVWSHRGFAALEARFNWLDGNLACLESRIDARFDSMQADLKRLNRRMTALRIDLALVKNKVGLRR
jgi:hypothetical protein